MTTTKHLLFTALALASTNAMADWSTTVTGASDYTFNGVSQTQDDPAIQGSLDYGFDSGVYAGSWASNVDFADDTNLEWDFYVGKFITLNESWSMDYGIAYYSYHGDTNSSDGNYPEVYSKFGFTNELGQTEFNFWYSWDYFGTGAGHTIAMIAHSVEVAEGHTLRASFDVSNSLDGDKYMWDAGDKSYYHYLLAYQTSVEGFNLELAAENTSLDYNTADERIVFSVSRTFSL
ncbi:TorF family putative porin [Pseudoalteromonas sp. MMG012]|uniref:TorF family putative porin n=1 Tax=Pseudoalteromonas sp. MMG012 TaxID=2822686 RepID=UPI001B3A692C|nr:TorF family putative porin [Pseudoalteromonas sp. MMG012]MBQ4852406.1 TorF family putative porin [Pseudoalteromonas sp. MMG012]